jgi:hypothetical protein
MAMSTCARFAWLIFAAHTLGCSGTLMGMARPTASSVPLEFVAESSTLDPIDLVRVAATPKTFVPGETEPMTLRFDLPGDSRPTGF